MTVFFSTTPDPSSQEEGTTDRQLAVGAKGVSSFNFFNFNIINTTINIMKKLFILALLAVAATANAQRTPTMGWSSWNT